jgi:hypothetical protein
MVIVPALVGEWKLSEMMARPATPPPGIFCLIPDVWAMRLDSPEGRIAHHG